MIGSNQTVDPYSPTFQLDAPANFAALAGSGSVEHVKSRFDFFVVSDPDYIVDTMLGDVTQWSNERGPSAVEQPPELMTAIVRDDESHLWLRRIIQRAFSPAELARLSPVIDRLINDAIATMLANPHRKGDFVELLARPMPTKLMCVILGVPEADWALYKSWADHYFYSLQNDPDFNVERNMAAVREVSEALFTIVSERRAILQRAGREPTPELIGDLLPNDCLSRFLCDRLGDAPIDDATVLGLMLAIILGGSETTMSLLGNMVFRMLDEREHWEAVKADPSLIEKAIEESLRLDPPVLGMFRTARNSCPVGVATIPANAKAFYNVSAVNRDPGQFPDPERFRLDRPRATMRKHASFSGGMHLCLGAPLVRHEVRATLLALTRRLPELKLNGAAERSPGFNVWGKTRLPVSW